MFTRIMLILSLMLAVPALSGCAALGQLGTNAAPPAPLAATQIDDNAIKTAYRAFDLALDSVNVLIDLNVIKPGTPSANRIADAIELTKSSLNAARSAQQAGQSANYTEAMGRVRDAFIDLRVLVAKGT